MKQNIYEQIIKHYGTHNQRIKTIEELSELIQALSRNDDIDNIAEEIADCYIMLEQLELIYNLKRKVGKYIEEKLDRTLLRIAKEK